MPKRLGVNILVMGQAANPAGHVPVLGAAIREYLSGTQGLLVDCTVGLGGHCELLLSANPSLEIIGLDLDETNLAIADSRLKPTPPL